MTIKLFSVYEMEGDYTTLTFNVDKNDNSVYLSIGEMAKKQGFCIDVSLEELEAAVSAVSKILKHGKS